MHLEVNEVVQGAVHVHREFHVPHVTYKVRHMEKFERVYEAHQIDLHKQEVVLNALRSCSGCSLCSP
jgi:hypothetical protein